MYKRFNQVTKSDCLGSPQTAKRANSASGMSNNCFENELAYLRSLACSRSRAGFVQMQKVYLGGMLLERLRLRTGNLPGENFTCFPRGATRHSSSASGIKSRPPPPPCPSDFSASHESRERKNVFPDAWAVWEIRLWHVARFFGERNLAPRVCTGDRQQCQ